MELVGRAVKKRFPGYGIFDGVVESYDPTAGFFRVLYDDGDSEELDYGEISSMLMEMSGEGPSPEMQVRKNGRGRPPKKRRRNELDVTGGEDVDLGSGRLADAVVVGDGGLTGQIGVVGENGGRCGVSACDGDGFAGALKENGSTTAVEISGNDDCLNEETGGNGSDVGFMGSVEVKLEAASGLSDGDEHHIETRELLENGHERESEHAKVEEPKSEICDFDGTPLQNQEHNRAGSVESNEGSTKKRRRLSGKTYTQDMPLRRSARRASAAAQYISDPFHSHISKTESRFQNCTLGETDSYMVLEVTKPELPPSSSNLDLDGLPILDFFSVYSFLRSFGRVLFLSPFSLEMFLAALKCNYANSLIDHIHFSILQTLKQHLELLSEEGSQPASDCLRNFNWDLLDLVTWPVYLVGYLLNHSSTINSVVKLNQPNILNTEYYTQPASVKLEMLRCLCDNVVEAEVMRSELNIRMTGSESYMDTSNNVYRDRYDLCMHDLEGSLIQEIPNDTADGNSDECCLCKMDGSLICCDGCPAAFHSRCVGVVKDLLPDGDWYCPECLMEKHDGLTKLSMSSRGADVLGIDYHGRVYFSSCGYLLVSDSYDSVTSSHFYNKDDLDVVIRLLKSSHASYAAISNAISAYQGVTLKYSSFNSQSCNEIFKRNDDIQFHNKDLFSSFQDVASDDAVEKNSNDNGTNEPSGLSSTSPSDLRQTDLSILDNPPGISHVFADSEHEGQLDDKQTMVHCCTDTDNPVNEVIPAKTVDGVTGNSGSFAVANQDGASFISEQRKVVTGQLPSDPDGYINNYVFGRVASSFAEDLMRKPPEIINKEPKMSEEDLAEAQLKLFSKRCQKVNYYNFLKLSLDIQNEKCGWCHSCKTSSSGDCLVVVNDKHLEVSKEHSVGCNSEKKRISHIDSAIHDLLWIEDRLNGLLSGPWENPHYSSAWRKAVRKASSLALLKQMLLILESSLRRVAMSMDWVKSVDSSQTVGSASHTFIGSVDASLNCNGNRKQGRRTNSVSEFNISQAAGASHVCWWRGGQLSRQAFHWKVLPRSLTFKGGRQAGCKKISNVSYPDGTEFARRSKFVSWRAAVEMSKTVAQLIFLIKEFHSNIRWPELLKSPPSLQLTKESKSLVKLFKKVIIRRKCIEGTNVRYLLDFGKRENLPPIVTRNGVIHEDPSSERKKFWLGESHVPLFLIKGFEMRKLARSMKKMGSELLSAKVDDFSARKQERSEGFSYLISKAEKLEIKLCGQCNKNVLIREAVKCYLCDGYFHRRHYRVPKGILTADYICGSCKEKASAKFKLQKQKVISQKNKVSADKKLKVSPKKRKRILLKNKKKPDIKGELTQVACRQALPRQLEITGYRKRKRTIMHYSLWLNGLKWTRKEDDAQGKHFRKAKVILPSQRLIRSSKKPVCCLCLKEYNPEVAYVSCENCGDWFHGDAYSLLLEEINNIIGFKCHKCRGRSIPSCPFSSHAVNEVDVATEQHEDDFKCARDDAIVTFITECHEESMPVCLSSSFAVTEAQSSREFTTAETISLVGQDIEEKLPSVTVLSSSPIVHKDFLDLQEDGTACVRDEATYNFGTEFQGRNIPVCPSSSFAVNEGQLSTLLTIPVTVVNMEEGIEERLNGESSSPAINDEDYMDEEKDDSTSAIDDFTFISETEFHERSIPVCSSSNPSAGEVKLFGEFTIEATLINMDQDVQEKLHSGTLESFSSVVCGEGCLYRQKDDPACTRDEAIFPSQDEDQERSIPACSSSSLTVNEVQSIELLSMTVINVGLDSEEELHSEAIKSSSPVVNDEDSLDQCKYDSSSMDGTPFTSKTESRNGLYCLPSFSRIDETAVPCPHGNDFHVVAASQETRKSTSEMVIVQELLVPDTLEHSKDSHK